MTVDWPSKFPETLFSNYSFSMDESIVRTQMEGGPARQRRRFVSVPSQATVRWRMKDDIFGFFEAWFKFKANNGAEWIRIDLTNGAGHLTNEARFLKPYSARPLSGDLWEVTANLEIRVMPTIPEASLDLLLTGFTIGQLELDAARLHKIIHTDLSTIHKW